MLTVRRLAAVILAAAFGALGAAFALQYGAGVEPCALCLYQRYLYGATILLGLAAIAAAPLGRLGLAFAGLAGLALFADAGVAFYHVGVEQGWFEGLAACGGSAGATPDTLEALREALNDAPPPSCADVPWSLFGISIAGYNLIYTSAFAAFALIATLRLWRSPRP